MSLSQKWLRRDKDTRGKKAKNARLQSVPFRPFLVQLEDRLAPATFTVLNTSDSGPDSLRQAMLDANAALGKDEIHFNIPGTGVHTISPSSTLPTIIDPVIIDGYTQGQGTADPSDDAKPNTLAVGSDAVLLIEINRAAFTGDLFQLSGGGSGSTVRGLVISHADGGTSFNIGFGINSINNTIAGNFIGTDPAGAVALGGTATAIVVINGSTGNTIGGTAPADRNVIVGGTGIGIVSGFTLVQGNYIGLNAAGTAALQPPSSTIGIRMDSSSGNNTIGGTTPGAGNVIVASGTGIGVNALNQNNVIQGNLIGTNATGTAGLGGAIKGVAIGGNNNTIGGAAAGAGNLISGNQDGIFVTSQAEVGTIIQGNKIGTDITGTAAIPNSVLGLRVSSAAAGGGSIGGANPGEGNTIAFNGGVGVLIANNPGWAILGNSIHSNTLLGIELAGGSNDVNTGAERNDVGDADTGSNNLQNYPVLLEVLSTAVDSTILGSLNSLARTDFLIQFFANDVADPSGHGEGQRFLGATVVRTNSAGNVNFSADVPALLTPDQQITSTATRLFDHDSNPATPSVPTDTSEFSQAISGATSILELDGPTIERDLPLNNVFTFRLDVPPGIDARLTAHFTDPQIGEILVRRGDLPDVNDFAERVVAFVTPDPEFLLAGFSVPYFISVRGTSTAGVPLGHFALTAETVGLEIGRITPNHGSNAGQVTTTIFGTGFSAETVFSLVGPGAERPAVNIVQQSETSFFVTFNLAGLTPGSYGVRAVDGASSTEVAGAFTVTTGNPGRFEAQLIVPARTLQGRESVLVVEYANLGETDIPAPMLFVESINSLMLPRTVETNLGTLTFPPQLPPDRVAQFLAISQTGPAGVLPPGARERLEIRFQDDGSVLPNRHPTLFFKLNVAEPGFATFDLASAKDDLRPPNESPEAWDVVFNNLLTRFGTTVGSYVQALQDAATYLSRYGIYTSDIDRLLSLYFAQADNALPGGSPHSAIDAAAPANGVPLVWGRTFAPTISRRFDFGIMGRGWSHPWDLCLSRDPETDQVLIRTPGGTRRFSEQPDGSFVGSLLDPAQLTLQSGVFSLRETNGTISRFDETTRLLLDVTDRNGHSVTLNYVAGTLVSLVHSSGDQFDFGYNAAGRLSQLTDQAGRVTTYEYDPAGEHLIRVTGPDGVWEYTYETTAGSPAEHALTSVTRPDGTHVFYEYDDQGRRGRTSRDGGAEAVTFTYGSAGEVFLTDALDKTTSLFFNEIGQLLETRDPLDRSARFDYDLVRRLDRVTLPLDTVALYDFDDIGNLTFVVKPDGGSRSFTYDTTFNLPTTIRDERSIPLRYAYDAQGNLTSIIHADRSVERFTPDADGNITQSINRRSQAIDYTYDARGRMLRKDHADGTFEEFTYDDRGNLLTATDEAGTTLFTHDAADRLTKTTYPNGRFLEYTYDAGGRRIRLEDQDGFVVKYRHDAAGRIAELTDGSDARLVLYTYDSAGRLAREDNGNLTFTIYEYDDAGQLKSLVNHLPDGAVSSQFVYGYDALGRRISVTTLEGLTTFGYDAIGQLTLVVLPDSRIIQYRYDAAGNRTAVIDNGVTTDYKPNNLNQYSRIGSFDRTYDADGNLITDEAGGPGGTTYAYDDESRLLSWVDGVLSVGYEYDALGNRTAKVEGGVRTEFLNNPLGLTNVVGEYDTAGDLVAGYVHSRFGLVSRHDSGGTAAYYDFDASGSTVAMTNASGFVANQYSYLPFGETLSITETIVNPFEFVGQFGVQRDVNGLDFMRARYYSSDDGRFINEDPIGVAGGLNLYQYVGNQPTSLVDPSGLTAWALPGGLVVPLLGAAATIAGIYVLLLLIELIDTIPDGEPVTTEIDTEEDPPSTLEDPSIPSIPSIPTIPTIPNLPNLPLPIPKPPGLAALPFTPGPVASSELETSDLFDSDDPDLDFPEPPGDPLDDDSTNQVGSVDPNDIIGPAGFGPDQFLQADSSLFYTIRFENLAAATAPAQTVVVTQTLDSDFDLSTFELLSFGIGASVVNVPAGHSSFLQRFDLRPDRNLLLDVGGDLNFETGVITWTFTSLDPATLELPDDPLGGFLPPNQTPPEGEGFVRYIVRPKPGLPTGTRIDAQASIVFDVNAPIDTPAIFNTLDAGQPTSTVAALPAAINSSRFALTWAGADDAGGSGIVGYDVFVSDNGGAFALFRNDTLETTAEFRGRPGHTYNFYSIAKDGVGHEQLSFTPVTTTVGGAPGTAFTFFDDDGDRYTLSLTGPGQLQFLLDDLDLDGNGPIGLVVLENTNPAKSKLSVKIKKGLTGDGRVSIGSIEGTGVKSITATASNLIGFGIDLTGPLGNLKIRDILAGATIHAAGTAAQKTTITAHAIDDNVTFNLGTTIASFTAAAMGTGSIIAPSIGNLIIRGDAKNKVGTVITPIPGNFKADLTLTGTGDPKKPITLGTARISGDAIDSDWNVTGGIRSITAKNWNGGSITAASLGTLSIKGNFTGNVTLSGVGILAGKPVLKSATVGRTVEGSTIQVAGTVSKFNAGEFVNSSLLVGYTPTNPGDPFAGGTFAPNAKLASFRVLGIKGVADPAFENSFVAATSFGTVYLKSIDGTNAGTKFGLLADVGIDSLTVTTPSLKLKKIGASVTLDPAFGDFEVRVV